MDQHYGIMNKDHHHLVETFQSFGKKKSITKKPTSKLKILYVTFFEYPHMGGLSHYITSVKEGFENREHEVVVLSPNQMSEKDLQHRIPEVANEVRAYMLKRYGEVNEKIIKNTSFLIVFEEFLRMQHLEKFDVIHAQDLFALFVLGKLNQEYQKTIFFTPHGFFTKSRLKFNKMKKGSLEEAYFTEVEKQGIRASDEIIIISDSFRNPLIDFGAKDENMTTVYTGINFQPEIKEKEDHKLIISSVSRLSPRKGHEYFFKALSQLEKEELSKVDVWIVGDGVMRGRLENLVEELGLENVIFFGKRTDVAKLLSKSSIFVLSTINDNFPLSVIEAMFAGQAIITSNCGGIPEMIQDGETGMICEPGDTDQIKDALKLLINNIELRNSLGIAAKTYAEKHLRQDVMISKLEKVYQSYL
ncbi:glycosyltransferase family 4 protein [Cytobacillus sp. FJAT-54145]|uniref:Glycosyltransferase family 4 protein n=1 Tax=Cytobacillus spartinae TaxID=3299023 RepID=A0ABW6K8P1_9BACI